MSKDCSVWQGLVALVGRFFIALIFIVAGLQKIIQFDIMMDAVSNISDAYATWILVSGILFELVGGILVFIGWGARWGAFLLFVYTIVVTFLFHSFWGFEGGEMVHQTHHFLKNIAILGGLLYVIAYGAGCISIDAYRRKCNDKSCAIGE